MYWQDFEGFSQASYLMLICRTELCSIRRTISRERISVYFRGFPLTGGELGRNSTRVPSETLMGNTAVKPL